MEEVPDVRITLDSVGKELVIRTGDAAPIELPQALTLKGAIDSASRFVKLRRDTLIPLETHVVYHRTEWSITLVSGERGLRPVKVFGQLAKSRDLAAFGINSGKRMSAKDMAAMMRSNRRFFTHREENEKLIVNLSMFTARVETEIKAQDNRAGHVLASIERKLTHEIPLQFKLHLHLFEGIKSEAEFNVEIVPDITDGGVQFYLDSIDLTEIIETRRDAIIEAELAHLQDYVIITAW